MSISLTSSGLSFSDDYNRANGAPGANYTVPGGYSASIASNRLRLTGRGLNEIVQVSGAPSVSTPYAEAILFVVGSGAEASLMLRDGGGYYMLQFFGGNLTLYRGSSGFTQLWQVSFALVVGQQYRVNFYAASGLQAVWVDGVKPHADTADTTSGATGGKPALRSTVDTLAMELDSIVQYTGKTITVTGLPTGCSARVKNGGGAVVAGPTTEMGGVATVELGGVALPFASVEVLSAGGAVVGSPWVGSGYPGSAFAYAAEAYVRNANTAFAPVSLAAVRAAQHVRTVALLFGEMAVQVTTAVVLKVWSACGNLEEGSFVACGPFPELEAPDTGQDAETSWEDTSAGLAPAGWARVLAAAGSWVGNLGGGLVWSPSSNAESVLIHDTSPLAATGRVRITGRNGNAVSVGFTSGGACVGLKLVAEATALYGFTGLVVLLFFTNGTASVDRYVNCYEAGGVFGQLYRARANPGIGTDDTYVYDVELLDTGELRDRLYLEDDVEPAWSTLVAEVPADWLALLGRGGLYHPASVNSVEWRSYASFGPVVPIESDVFVACVAPAAGGWEGCT